MLSAASFPRHPWISTTRKFSPPTKSPDRQRQIVKHNAARVIKTNQNGYRLDGPVIATLNGEREGERRQMSNDGSCVGSNGEERELGSRRKYDTWLQSRLKIACHRFLCSFLPPGINYLFVPLLSRLRGWLSIEQENVSLAFVDVALCSSHRRRRVLMMLSLEKSSASIMKSRHGKFFPFFHQRDEQRRKNFSHLWLFATAVSVGGGRMLTRRCSFALNFFRGWLKVRRRTRRRGKREAFGDFHFSPALLAAFSHFSFASSSSPFFHPERRKWKETRSEMMKMKKSEWITHTSHG